MNDKNDPYTAEHYEQLGRAFAAQRQADQEILEAKAKAAAEAEAVKAAVIAGIEEHDRRLKAKAKAQLRNAAGMGLIAFGVAFYSSLVVDAVKEE